MPAVKCDWCGEELARSPRRKKVAKKHFCNTDHYIKYKRKYKYYNHTQKTNAYQKIKTLAAQLKEEGG